MKHFFLYILLFTSLNIIARAQKFDSFKDNRDGKIYNTVKIGEQVWMSENLEVDKFQNGDKIRKVNSSQEWILACNRKEPVWMYSPNNMNNGKKFGKIYNFYAVIDKRNLAPINFRIPFTSDFLSLNNLSFKSLKSQTGWFVSTFTRKVLENVDRIDRNGFPYVDLDFVEREFTIGRSGSNESGFNAFPSGSINVKGIFDLFGKEFCLWSSTKGENSNTQQILKISWDKEIIQIINASVTQGFYVRCVSGKTQEEIEFERILKNKREKFINDSIKNDKLEKDIKAKQALDFQIAITKRIEDSIEKINDDSVRMRLEIGSKYKDGIVISIDKSNSKNIYGLLVSNYEKVATMNESIRIVGSIGQKWRFPKKSELEYLFALTKENKKINEFFNNSLIQTPNDANWKAIPYKIFWYWAVSDDVDNPTFQNFWLIFRENGLFRKNSLLTKYYKEEKNINNFYSRVRFVKDF